MAIRILNLRSRKQRLREVETETTTALKSHTQCWCDNPECCRIVQSDSAGVFHFELLALLALAALFIAFLSGGIVEPQDFYAAWFMPFVGIAAATNRAVVFN